MDECTGIDRETFEAEIVAAGRPVVMRGFADDWPIVARAGESREALADYIAGFGADTPVKAFFGDASIRGRYFYDETLTGFNFDRRELPLRELLDTLLANIDADDADGIYAGAIPLRDGLAGILRDNENPLLDASTEQLVSIWIGNRGRTAPHWDLPQNIAVDVAGSRTFTLFPPEQLQNLYVGPIDFTLAGQPISLVDLHDPDFERFPRFADALEAAEVTRLEPGDALYLPSMWFHHVESHDPLGVLVNYWWRDAEAWMFTPLFTLLHGLLSIRDLPAREREIWRNMFEHYLFREDGDPMPHVPEEARGVLREMTQERAARLRAYLLHSLGGMPRR